VKTAGNTLRERLQEVYWITGGACAGKTTVTHLLSHKHGIEVLPDRIGEYRATADFGEFPALRDPNPNTDWEWFFNRPIDEYVCWLEDMAAAMMQFILTDLVGSGFGRPIIVEQFTDPAQTAAIVPRNRVIAMFADEGLIEEELLQRADHKMILECIEANVRDPRAAKTNASKPRWKPLVGRGGRLEWCQSACRGAHCPVQKPAPRS
jgi:hypothetical protein